MAQFEEENFEEGTEASIYEALKQSTFQINDLSIPEDIKNMIVINQDGEEVTLLELIQDTPINIGEISVIDDDGSETSLYHTIENLVDDQVKEALENYDPEEERRQEMAIEVEVSHKHTEEMLNIQLERFMRRQLTTAGFFFDLQPGRMEIHLRTDVDFFQDLLNILDSITSEKATPYLLENYGEELPQLVMMPIGYDKNLSPEGQSLHLEKHFIKVVGKYFNEDDEDEG